MSLYFNWSYSESTELPKTIWAGIPSKNMLFFFIQIEKKALGT